MRYLGGKSRIAKEIAAVVAPQGYWWEPFCGGLSVSVQLAKYGPGLVSDANPALIALYCSVARGWLPPEAISAEEYQAAKRLPDSDPRKAFIGFGCSFGGKWFGGLAAHQRERPSVIGGRAVIIREDAVRAARNSLLRDLPALAPCAFRLLSFLAVDPAVFPSQPESIYCDPPYSDTTGYAATGPFDHGKFWSHCQAWAARGVRVFVSEYQCPVGADVVWAKAHRDRLRGREGQQLKTERLFRVHAPSVARCA